MPRVSPQYRLVQQFEFDAKLYGVVYNGSRSLTQEAIRIWSYMDDSQKTAYKQQVLEECQSPESATSLKSMLKAGNVTEKDLKNLYNTTLENMAAALKADPYCCYFKIQLKAPFTGMQPEEIIISRTTSEGQVLDNFHGNFNDRCGLPTLHSRFQNFTKSMPLFAERSQHQMCLAKMYLLNLALNFENPIQVYDLHDFQLYFPPLAGHLTNEY